MKRNIILGAVLTVAVGIAAMSPKLADGLLGDCRKLLVADGKLIAGGYFEKADRRVVNNIAQYDGAKWTGLAKGVDGIVRDLCSVGKDVYACGDFSYADKKDDGGVESNQLPVELTEFTGRKSEQGVELAWRTASELNNSGFEVERKSQGADWNTLGFVRGNGTTTEAQSYSFLDRTATGKVQYA